VFIGNSDLQKLWSGPARYYLVADSSTRPRIENLLGKVKVVRTHVPRRIHWLSVFMAEPISRASAE
jgi:hypothetical protein